MCGVHDVSFMPFHPLQLFGRGGLQHAHSDTGQCVSGLLPSKIKHWQRMAGQRIQCCSYDKHIFKEVFCCVPLGSTQDMR